MTDHARSALGLRIGDRVEWAPKNRRYKVTATDVRVLPSLHEYLVGVAKRRGTITYGEVKDDLFLPHAVNGLGRLLDILSYACDEHLKEPSLAALVVTSGNGEVGDEFDGDPVAAREEIYAHWA